MGSHSGFDSEVIWGKGEYFDTKTKPILDPELALLGTLGGDGYKGTHRLAVLGGRLCLEFITPKLLVPGLVDSLGAAVVRSPNGGADNYWDIVPKIDMRPTNRETRYLLLGDHDGDMAPGVLEIDPNGGSVAFHQLHPHTLRVPFAGEEPSDRLVAAGLVAARYNPPAISS